MFSLEPTLSLAPLFDSQSTSVLNSGKVSPLLLLLRLLYWYEATVMELLPRSRKIINLLLKHSHRMLQAGCAASTQFPPSGEDRRGSKPGAA